MLLIQKQEKYITVKKIERIMKSRVFMHSKETEVFGPKTTKFVFRYAQDIKHISEIKIWRFSAPLSIDIRDLLSVSLPCLPGLHKKIDSFLILEDCEVV